MSGEVTLRFSVLLPTPQLVLTGGQAGRVGAPSAPRPARASGRPAVVRGKARIHPAPKRAKVR